MPCIEPYTDHFRSIVFPSILEPCSNENREHEERGWSHLESRASEKGDKSHLTYIIYLLNFSSHQVATIFYYLCVVGLQYIAPIVLCIGFTLMNKTLGMINHPGQQKHEVNWRVFLGGYGWFGQHTLSDEQCGLEPPKTVTLSNLLESEDSSLSSARNQWLIALSSFRQVKLV